MSRSRGVMISRLAEFASACEADRGEAERAASLLMIQRLREQGVMIPDRAGCAAFKAVTGAKIKPRSLSSSIRYAVRTGGENSRASSVAHVIEEARSRINGNGSK